MADNRPQFFIIGAPKCGTTSLYHWLKTHPQIFMPTAKEPHFFTSELSDRYCRVRDIEKYLALFDDAHENQICGEASVLYSFFPKSIEKVLEFNPAAKIIYMIRNPIEMAPSYHGQLLVNLEEDVVDFEKAWSLMAQRHAGENLPKTSTDHVLLQYAQVCALGQHLKQIATIVPKGQLKVILLSDLAENPQKIYGQVLEFLGVNNDGRKEFEPVNEGAAIHSRLLQKIRASHSPLLKLKRRFLKKIIPNRILEKLNRAKRRRVVLSPLFQVLLKETFEEDIKIIEKYLKRDLSQWRDV